MRVFITGATGLLGYNIVEELLKKNHQIFALVRSFEKGRHILNPEVSLVEGDMRNVTGFAHRLRSIDVLIHAAACYSEYYNTSINEQPYEVNVKGTRALLEAANRYGVKKVVYISSAGVLQTRKDQPADESSPYAVEKLDPYFQSKIDAEQEVYRFLKSHPSMQIMLMLPSVMLGPGDWGLTPTGKLIVNLLKRKMKFILPGSNRIVDVRDVALAVIAGIQKGRSGERYVIGGQKYKFTTIYQCLGEVSGKPVPSWRPSPHFLMLAARIMGLLGKVTGKSPALKPNLLKRLLENSWYDSGKAERELGVHFRPLTETLSDTVQWFQAQGYDT